ncbi:MAG: hypothetical protein DRQ62_09935 [Gammaproteobacteria bacterium]|nr:MAG: hypothetical protein DRQ62_09935 [Gammaproteobacteria bacterium]
MAATNRQITYNHDISGFHRRFNRFITELKKSVSSSGSLVNAFDKKRLATYIAALRSYQKWVTDQPALDLPDTHPRAYELDDNPEYVDLENESIVDAIRMLELARDELVRSQSSRSAAGLIEHDDVRLTAMINKIDSFLTSYIEEITPLDLPESSPQTEMSGDGQTGV